MIYEIDKPWGTEEVFALTDKYCGKILKIKAGHQTSLQYHIEKDETLYTQVGLAQITLGEITTIVDGDSQPIRVEPMTIHRIRAIEDSTILEVSTPELDDVVRIEDDYGRKVVCSTNTNAVG